MIHCICIDDTNKPKEIPAEKWVTKDASYNIIHVSIHTLQGGIQGVTLKEITLDESCMPYQSFRLSRFAVQLKDIEKLMELMRNCSELSNIDIMKLIEESNLQLVEN